MRKKLKNPSDHFLIKIQLYLPWRNKGKLKNEDQSYKEKYFKNLDEISRNMHSHKNLEPIDYNDLQNSPDANNSDSDFQNCRIW